MPEIAGPEWNLSGILRRFRRIRNSEDRFCSPPPPFFPPFKFPLSFCLSRSGFRADSIKRLFVAAKRRVRHFVRDASHFSLSSLSLFFPSFSCIHRFLLHLPFSSFFFATRRYRCRLRFINANESFRDALAVHPRMRTIWRIRMRRRKSRV